MKHGYGYAKILRRVSPTKSEGARLRKISSSIIGRLSAALPEGTRTLLAGSVAKGTFLRGAGDIDVFAIFPVSYSKEKMFESLKGAAKKAFPRAKFEVGYAEHPYLRMYYLKKKIDLVPSYEMKEGQKVKSAVDRSQLHTKYVLKTLKPKQKAEVLLLKKFLRANGLYGAEIKIRGFSGYLCELMIAHYGSFEAFVNAAALWKAPIRLDPAKKYRTDSAIPDFGAPLTVIDPVDLTRNVSAVISGENFLRLVFLCASFRAEPSEIYFFPKKFTKKQLESAARGRSIFALSFGKPRIVDDVLWGQLWRLSSQLSSFLKKAEFKVLGSHAYAASSRCLLLFELRSPELPKMQTFRGPFLDLQKDVSAFIKKHEPPFYFDEGRIHAIAERRLRNVSSAIKDFKECRDAPSHLRGKLARAALLGEAALIRRFPDALEEYLRRSSPPHS
ncbi:CCA tRNA nucleotidyltransferase [Candidatus Micrarchaeota archaeon]|nr:CCA tRNA nucleotidyltransferase [Candidatus Micrarchaeota archaeon]